MFKCLVLIISFVLTEQVEVCPDRWALNQVDVWVHERNINSKGYYNKSVNINEFDNHKMIDVIKANVSVLCEGMIKKLPHLEYLTLIEVNISKIQPEAFQQLPKLKHLSLASNHLKSIKKEQFKNLEKIKQLYLSSNEIEDIEENAFSELIELQKIYLDRNNIYEIDNQWFLNNPRISLIDMSFNKITKLQTAAFTIPRNNKMVIQLYSNQIETVEPRPIISEGNEKPYLILNLSHNKLTSITADFLESMNQNLHSILNLNSNMITCVPLHVLKLLQKISLRLELNECPLLCECMEDLNLFVMNHELKATFNFNTVLNCTDE